MFEIPEHLFEVLAVRARHRGEAERLERPPERPDGVEDARRNPEPEERLLVAEPRTEFGDRRERGVWLESRHRVDAFERDQELAEFRSDGVVRVEPDGRSEVGLPCGDHTPPSERSVVVVLGTNVACAHERGKVRRIHRTVDGKGHKVTEACVAFEEARGVVVGAFERHFLALGDVLLAGFSREGGFYLADEVEVLGRNVVGVSDAAGVIDEEAVFDEARDRGFDGRRPLLYRFE